MHTPSLTAGLHDEATTQTTKVYFRGHGKHEEDGDVMTNKEVTNNRTGGAYQQAKTKWTKMVSDRTARQYRVYEASGKLPDPQFCGMPFNQQIALAFRGINTISDKEHPVLRAMRGDIP
jgi:hypothetical protein